MSVADGEFDMAAKMVRKYGRSFDEKTEVAQRPASVALMGCFRRSGLLGTRGRILFAAAATGPAAGAGCGAGADRVAIAAAVLAAAGGIGRDRGFSRSCFHV